MDSMSGYRVPTRRPLTTYVPRLVEALADSFHQALLDVQGRRTEGLDLEVGGLENQLVNEVALASSW